MKQDWRITAYALGELGPVEERKVGAALALDPELRDELLRIERALSFTSQALGREPLPERTGQAKVLVGPWDRVPRDRPPRRRWAFPMAATAALAFGGAALAIGAGAAFWVGLLAEPAAEEPAEEPAEARATPVRVAAPAPVEATSPPRAEPPAPTPEPEPQAEPPAPEPPAEAPAAAPVEPPPATDAALGAPAAVTIHVSEAGASVVTDVGAMEGTGKARQLRNVREGQVVTAVARHRGQEASLKFIVQRDGEAVHLVLPARERPPQLEVGTLFVNAKPWARVRIRGRDQGTTPLTLRDLPVGKHRVDFEKGSRVISRSCEVTAGARTTCIATFD